jgi:VIT1/CCC1 family predicted Fe2+/Mn2+ transporter
MAADRLAEAKVVQDRTIPEADASAPSPNVNRKILESLATAKGVRTAIDTTLKDIGSSVLSLRGRLRDSRAIAADTRARMERLAATLGLSAGPASVTARELRRAVATLQDSGRLGAQILAELRELDRRSGGPVP